MVDPNELGDALRAVFSHGENPLRTAKFFRTLPHLMSILLEEAGIHVGEPNARADLPPAVGLCECGRFACWVDFTSWVRASRRRGGVVHLGPPVWSEGARQWTYEVFE